jgi:transcriptional antiterminator NusG
VTEHDVDTQDAPVTDQAQPFEPQPPEEEQTTPDATTESPPDVERVTPDEVVDEDPAADVEVNVEAEAPMQAEAVEATAEAEAAESSEEEEDEEGEEGEEEPDMFALGDWYVVHTYAGYENKVKANLASRIQSMNMEDKIYEVVVPTEEVMELKSGKMQSVQKKVFPGYILVRMSLDDDSWYVVRNTPGVTGFVGSGAKPTPLDFTEVTKILAPKTDERPKPKLEYETGEVVSVIGGAFAGYSGPVSAIEVDKQRVTVLLDLFGRETPVELTFDQVTKL